MAKKPDYGGAFDIDPSSFWCRNDIDELQSELEDRKFIKQFGIKIKRGYIEEDNRIELDYEYDGIEYTVKQKIDMRKIKKPRDLQLKYVPILEILILKQIKDIKE